MIESPRARPRATGPERVACEVIRVVSVDLPSSPAPFGRARSSGAALARRCATTLAFAASALLASTSPAQAPPQASVTATPSAAPGPSPSAEDTQLADLRFHEGKALLDQGAVKEACEKLAQSLALHRRGGTLLNLADCRKREGRAATALQLFQEAFDFAKAEGRADRMEIAQQGMKDARAGLVWLTITVSSGAAAQDVTIKLDGRALLPAEIGALIALDPGPHALVAEAPGKRPFDLTVTGGPAADRRAVEIPALEAIAGAPTVSASVSAPSPAPSAPPGQGQKLAGYILITGGVLVTLAAGISGGIAIEDSGESRRLCPNEVCTTQQGMDLNRSARDAALASDILFPAGLAMVTAGAIAYFLAPPPPKNKAAFAPWATPSGGGIGVTGQF